MKTITSCVICNSSIFSPYLEVDDFLLTAEHFTIVQCNHCGFRFINPQPDISSIGDYYKSENYISHHNSNSGLIPWLYRKIRNYNHGKKYSLISKIHAFETILDIGCATGEFLAFCKKKGHSCTGIEPDADARNFATEKFHLDVNEEAYIEKLPNNHFDVITMWHVIEHVYNLEERISTIKKLLKNDGILVLGLPNPDSFDASHFNEFWAGWDAPRHLWHFSQENVRQFITRFGFNYISAYPLIFDAYYISLISNSYKFKNKSIITSIYDGYVSNCNAKRTKNYSSLIYVFSGASTNLSL